MTHFIKENYLFINECAKMTKELYFADTLASFKYNKSLKTLLLYLHESTYKAFDESPVKN